MTVLVTGATGNVGSAVVNELSNRGVAVRAFVRDADAELPDSVEVAVGDLDDPASIRDALDGVDRVFLSTGDGPRKVEQEVAVIDNAGGVDLLLKASTVGAKAGSPLKPFDWHGRVEEHLRHSGVPYVVLGSGFYMTNLLAAAEPVRTQGILSAPAGAGRVAMIDPRDIGTVAAAVLCGSGHEGRTYRLTGPEAITYAEIAAILEVQYVDIPPSAAREHLEAAGMPDWLVDHLDRAFGLIRAGSFEDTTDSVRVLTGREPRSFAQFARDHADAFTRAPATNRSG
ncbi:MAG TPA: SDR family oxidoreductase [Solirubrobacteraceae bacterium]|nr:SDR family oxidoreductase [Solirubrobacteraceae bacterium]